LDGHSAPRAIDLIALGIDPVVVLVHPIGRNRLAWIASFLVGDAIVEGCRADAHNVAGANQIGRRGSDGRVLAIGALATKSRPNDNDAIIRARMKGSFPKRSRFEREARRTVAYRYIADMADF
jgi:hypothetical protein